MKITIEKSLLQQMIQTNIQHNQIMTQILSSLDQQEEWVDTSKAEAITGIPSNRIRYLFRSGQVEGRKRGQKIIEINLIDLQSFSKKEVS